MAEQTNASSGTGQSAELQSAPRRSMAAYEDMERMFDELFSRGWMRPFRERMADLGLPWEPKTPKLDILDREEEVVVRAEVPGMNKEDLEISVVGTRFTIKGQTKREEKEEKGDYYRCEVTRGSFSRTVTLPAEVDDAKAKAQLNNGILEVTLPKLEKARKRAITIS
ncbi:MAG TPA: Hsp20/alpha crystallin family protein [Burkholderiales bacterium]|nr:Hsp20/alpha crystallin family protein [Burkholderiales bacterium]